MYIPPLFFLSSTFTYCGRGGGGGGREGQHMLHACSNHSVRGRPMPNNTGSPPSLQSRELTLVSSF